MPSLAASESPSIFHRRLLATAMGLLVVVLSIHLLVQFSQVLQQLCIAAFVGYLILPVHRWLTRHRATPIIAFFLMVALFLLGTTLLGQMVYFSVLDIQSKQEIYQKNLLEMLRSVLRQFPNIDENRLNQLYQEQMNNVSGMVDVARKILGNFIGILGQTLIVLVYLFFLLSEKTGLPVRLQAAFGEKRAEEIQTVLRRINDSITAYIAVKTFMSVLTGVLTTVVLILFGVDLPVFWGLLAFVLNYIPYVGSLVAMTLPTILALVQFGSFLIAGEVLLTLTIVHQGIGNAIEPILAGNRINLSPLVIILSLAFWGTIWGIVGMILAVPLVVVVRTILDNIEETKPIARMLANQSDPKKPPQTETQTTPA